MKMQAHRVINWLLHYLGSRHPLAYFGLYLAMVPLFAAIYTSLNDGFYAPYAKYEKASTIELQRLRHALEAALQKYLKQRLIELEESGEILEYENYKLKSDELSVGIERLDITENITIRLLIYFSHSEKTETAAVFTNISLPFSFRLSPDNVMTLKNRKGYPPLMTFWVISRDPFAAPDDRFEDLFHSFFVPFTSEDADDLGGGGISEPAVAISVAESDAIKRYFRGYNGNPTDINENFWRMMYFSVVVLTTVGFGDIVPITNVARFAVAIEAVTGITLVGLFLNALANRIARAATRF